MGIKKIRIVFVVVIIALALCGVGYAFWTGTLIIDDTVQTGTWKAGFTACSTNDRPGTIDPGKDKDVGSCTAELAEPEPGIIGGWQKVIVTVGNAYPCYDCEVYVTVQNHGTVPIRIARVDIMNPDEVTVTHQGLKDVGLNPGGWVLGTVKAHLEQEALQGHSYTFTVEIGVAMWHTGTIGFWKNWDKHNAYTQDEIEGWLSSIDADSEWLGPTSVTDMVAMLEQASGGTMEQKFLGHYLAQRLNLESGRQGWDTTHDVTSIDGYGYLGLADPTSATALEIISAIESKHGTSPDKDQFETMKDICDALNELSI